MKKIVLIISSIFLISCDEVVENVIDNAIETDQEKCESINSMINYHKDCLNSRPPLPDSDRLEVNEKINALQEEGKELGCKGYNFN